MRFALAMMAAVATVATPDADAVLSLPGYGKPPSPQFSGFLNASAAEPGTMLHYWFAAADSPDWKNMPVVLWLNGGPGASSLIGMLQEQGPLIIDRAGGLVENPWAWTKLANLVALESPAGVGYSYCEAMKRGGACANTDITTAKAAHAALVDLLSVKFPELRANAFFITGESYAGVYSPTLAAEIVAGNAAGSAAAKINLVGMAVGDPCTDNAAQRDSMDMLWWAHKNGLVPEREYEYLWDTCGVRHPSALAAGAWRAEGVAYAEEGAGASDGADGASAASAGAGAARVRPAAAAVARRRLARARLSANCTAAYRKFLIASSKAVSQSWDKAFINELSFYSPAAQFRFDLPGTLNYHTAAYLMRDDVKAALHVDHVGVGPTSWPGPAPGWTYTSSYDACNQGKVTVAKSMVDFYRELAPALRGKIVVFNGDTDPCVSYEGTRTAIERVGFAVDQPTRPWFFNESAASADFLKRKDLLFGPSLALVGAGAQFGGQVVDLRAPPRPHPRPRPHPHPNPSPDTYQVVDYEHGLAFATVHGSGHMAPTFRPRAALQLLRHVLEDTPFAPPVPADAALAAMADAEFDHFLDQWVVTAESSQYVRGA